MSWSMSHTVRNVTNQKEYTINLVTASSNKFNKITINFALKAQRQICDILQGVRSLGVSFTRRFLAWYDK